MRARRYTPGRGTLRLVVVTDGDDCLSPGEYRGARGMNPLMRELKERGFNIEWCGFINSYCYAFAQVFIFP